MIIITTAMIVVILVTMQKYNHSNIKSDNFLKNLTYQVHISSVS